MQEKDNPYFAGLAEKWLNGQITEAERTEFTEWYAVQDDCENIEIPASFVLSEEIHRARILAAIEQKAGMNKRILAAVHRTHFMKRFRWVAAAVVLFAVAATYMLVNNDQPPQHPIAKRDVLAPQANRASIKLQNGRTIYLDTVAIGRVIDIGGAQMTKLADGKVAYSGNAAQMVYNTASNPRGSTVMDLELSDHSHVWLNAGSSLSYPVAFAGETRNVSMDGEAYFEVTHDAAKPFVVSKGATSVQVLGTHFNIKAYGNEPDLKVTLLEGKVKVSNGANEPAQQAVVNNNAIRLATHINPDEVIAWKNGFTSFRGADLKEILLELEHWYDITTEIKSDVKITRTIDVPRNVSLKDVLKSLLEDNGTRYEYDAEKRKLTVLP
jgi:transmembrane sensor